MLSLLITSLTDWLFYTGQNDLIPEKYHDMELYATISLYINFNRTVTALDKGFTENYQG